MRVILLADVKGQGKKDQIVEVSDGYGRNFLIAKGLAIPADNKAINEMKNREASRLHKIEVDRAAAQSTAKELEKISVKIHATAGADGDTSTATEDNTMEGRTRSIPRTNEK